MNHIVRLEVCNLEIFFLQRLVSIILKNNLNSETI